MITIEKIKNQNLGIVKNLLFDRSKTIPEYVQWKYETNTELNRGVIAFVDGEPVGCFGLIPRVLNISPDRNMICGWFADWYIIPQFRRHKIGTKLLNEITNIYPITIGHPGPQNAQLICKQNGFREIGFQSRRRLILKPWKYSRFRSHNPIKVLAQVIQNTAQKICFWQTSGNLNNVTDSPCPEDYGSFADISAYKNWIYSQPISLSMATREWKQWMMDDLQIFYAEDYLRSGEKRCLVLFTSGKSIYSRSTWGKFLSCIRKTGNVYIDIFTTNPKLDQIWCSIGAKRIQESPILIKNLPTDILLALQGWDRENWTYLASKK